MDILLAGGDIIDGTGVPPRTGSLLLRDGMIAEILAPGDPEPLVQRIDCTRLVIAPGFIDVHSHSDHEVIQGLSNKVLQGVTTEIVGNCSYSLFPMRPESQLDQLGSVYEGVPAWTIESAQHYFSILEASGPLLNVAALTGHTALRTYVIGMDRRPPSAEEQREMERLLEQSLEEGSIGFSTGLNLMPSSFAGFDELVSLCSVLKRYRAYYTTHMRDYKFHVVEAVREAIALAEQSGAAVQLSHVQTVGKKCWKYLDTILEMVDAAARRGVDIGMDAYPYLAGSCSIIQLLPEWCQAGGSNALLDRLESPALRDRIVRETEDYMSNTWADIVISGVGEDPSGSLIGKTVEQIAAENGEQPRNTVARLLREQQGQVTIISFNSCDENLRKVLSHPLTSLCTDGHVAKGLSHPRTFGTYPTFLGKYIREMGWMPIEQAIAKTSGLPARRFQLQKRGTIARGNWADLVVFDRARIATRSDYSSPEKSPEGIRMVLINGEIVVEDGALTGARSGRSLRHMNSGVAA